MATKHWWDWQREGFEYEEWDVLAQMEYQEYIELKREEKWERECGAYDKEGE